MACDRVTRPLAQRLPTSRRMATIAALEPDARPRERLGRARRGAADRRGAAGHRARRRDPRRQRASRWRRPCCAASAGRPGCSRATPRRARRHTPASAPVRATLVAGGAGARPARGRRAADPRSAAGGRVRGLDVFSRPARAAVGRGVLGDRASTCATGCRARRCLARGSLTGVEIHPRDVFRPLIRQGDGRGDLLPQPPVGRSGAVARGHRADRAPARGRRSRRHSRARSRRRRVGGLHQPRRAQLEIDRTSAATIAAVPPTRLPAALAFCSLLISVSRGLGDGRIHGNARARHGRRLAGLRDRRQRAPAEPVRDVAGEELPGARGTYGYSQPALGAHRCTPRWSTTRRRSASPAASTTPIAPASRAAASAVTATRAGWRCPSRSRAARRSAAP